MHTNSRFFRMLRIAVGMMEALAGAIMIAFNPRAIGLMRRTYLRRRLATR